MPSTYEDFPADFQDLLISCLISHPATFSYTGQVLSPKYFTGTQATIAAHCILEYQAAHGFYPTWPVFEQLVISHARHMGGEGDGPQKAFDYVRKLRAMNTRDYEHVSAQVVDFAKRQALIAAIRTSIKSIQSTKKEDKNVDYIKIFEAALSIGHNLDNMGWLLRPEDATRVVDLVTSREYGVSTGYPLLDSIWRNGWGPGWLIVPLAPPKRLKSSMALNLALNMVGPAIGADVIYYTCEISDELTLMRALCNLARMSMDSVFDSPERFLAAALNQMRQLVSGQLLIKGFSSKTATIQDMRAHAKMAVQEGMRPKAIVIDYAETVKPGAPTTKDAKEYRMQADIYTEARALGKEFGACVIMPDRCNGETVGKTVPNMRSFQGAFEKAGIVDVAFGICATDAEFLQNIIRVFIFLNRHGKALQHIRGKFDGESYQISLEEAIEYTPEEDEPPRRNGGGRRGGREGVLHGLPEGLQE